MKTFIEQNTEMGNLDKFSEEATQLEEDHRKLTLKENKLYWAGEKLKTIKFDLLEIGNPVPNELDVLLQKLETMYSDYTSNEYYKTARNKIADRYKIFNGLINLYKQEVLIVLDCFSCADTGIPCIVTAKGTSKERARQCKELIDLFNRLCEQKLEKLPRPANIYKIDTLFRVDQARVAVSAPELITYIKSWVEGGDNE